MFHLRFHLCKSGRYRLCSGSVSKVGLGLHAMDLFARKGGKRLVTANQTRKEVGKNREGHDPPVLIQGDSITQTMHSSWLTPGLEDTTVGRSVLSTSLIVFPLSR